MAITRLKRKALRNKLTSKLRIQKLGLESATPVIKNVDVKAIQDEFKAAKAKAPKATAAVEEPAKETKVAAKKAAPKAEKPAKKAAPKKETKKED